VVDELSERYGDLLAGSYDCVDRIVLNAYFSLGHNPGGFRVWWRRLHGDSDERLDNTHLMRMAGRFSRRLRASATAHGIPVIDCKRGERKHQLAEEYLATHTVGPGVFLILVARASAAVWEVTRSSSGVIVNLAKKMAFARPLLLPHHGPTVGTCNDQDARASPVQRAGHSQAATRTSPPTPARPGSALLNRAYCDSQ
jgi:hypothetical protein